LTDRPGPDASTRRGASLGYSARLRSHPAPRFLVAGGATFLIDIGSLKVLHGVAGLGLALSTVLAFAVAFGFNFTAVRQWAFVRTAREGQAHRQLVRYLVLVAVNLCSTVLIVVGLSAVGMPYLYAKVLAAGLNAVGNFFAYRHWVFAAPPVL
jgi:putative flippase GtrA